MRYCKSDGDFTIELYHRSSDIPSSWNGLLPQDHFLRTDQLAAYERMSLPDISFLYVLISQGSKILGVCYFQVLTIKAHHLNPDYLRPYQYQAWRLFTQLGCPKLLIAGHLFRHDICSYFWKEDIAQFDAFKIYQAAIQKALRLSHSSAVLVKDVNEALIPYFQHYAPQYTLLRNDISMQMDILQEWQNIGDYEKSLKHKYAQRFRKVRQPWDQLSVKELTVEETESNKAILYKLYQQVSSRQQVRLGMLSEDFLPELKKHNPHLRIWLAEKGNEPVAFFSAWTHNGAFDMFYIGFDYTRNDELQLYFNILFFAVEQAIGLGKSKLILGRTALEAKARLGCKPQYLSTYLYIRNSLVRNIINRLQQNINNQEGEWENRHPFKK